MIEFESGNGAWLKVRDIDKEGKIELITLWSNHLILDKYQIQDLINYLQLQLENIT